MSGRFFVCYFETTRRCNINCSYCMTRSEETRPELSTEEAKKYVIDELKKISTKAAISFSGGEFFLRPDALELVKYASSKGIFVIINTNAVSFNENIAKELNLATSGKILMAFSLDSIDKKKNRMLRGEEFSEIEKAVKICKKQDMGFFIMTTISKQSISTLKQTFSFISKNGIPILRSPFVPRGSAKNLKGMMFDRKDMKDNIFPVFKDNCMCYVSYTPFFADPEKVKKELKTAGLTLEGLGCQASRGFIGISAEGNVAPCVQLLDSPAECGNVKQKPLSKIVLQDPLMVSIRERKNYKGKCGKCKYLVSCGGCRAVAYYSNNDPLSEDTTCFFEAGEGKTSKDEESQNEEVRKFVKIVSGYKQFKELFG